MFVDNYSSIYSTLDFFSSYDSYPSTRRIYYETSIKKKKGDKSSNNNESNSLLNALRNFSVKYELDGKKFFKDYKFVISFDDIISLIRYSLESQKKLNEYEQEKSNYIKSFTHVFINNISNNINSYEKVEKINSIKNINNKIKHTSNKVAFNIIKNRTNKKKSSAHIVKSSSCWVEIRKAKTKQISKRETLTKNFQDNIKSNKRTINTNHMKNKIKNDDNKNINSEEDNNYMKSYFKRKNIKNLSNLFSPLKRKKNEEHKIKVTKSNINKSIERRSHKSQNLNYLSNDNKNKESSKNKNINKSLEKRNIDKNDIKIDNNPISIFTACEYVKSTSFMLKNRHRNKEESKLDIKYNTNNSLKNMHTNKENELFSYNDKNLQQSLQLGIKKKIIKGNIPRPSNLANKLLEKGIKYITDFNGLKEEEQRKKFH